MPSDLHHAFRSSSCHPIFIMVPDLHHGSRSPSCFPISIRIPDFHPDSRHLPNASPPITFADHPTHVLHWANPHQSTGPSNIAPPSSVQWIRSPLDGSFTRDSSFIQDISFIRHSSFIQDGSFTRYASFIRHKFSAFHIETIALRSEHHSMILGNPISIHKISAPYFTESHPFLPHRPLPHRNDYALQQSSPAACHMDLPHRSLPHRNDYALSGLKHIGRQIVQPHEHVHILRDIPTLRRDGLRIRPQGIPRTHGITGHFSG